MQSSVVDTVIKNANVVTAGGTFAGGVAISGGKIVAVAADQLLPQAREVIDAGGKHLMPGVIDHHVHIGVFRSFADDLRTQSRAAAFGGVTTLGVNAAKCMRMSRTAKARTGPEDIVPFSKVLPEAIEIANTDSLVDVSLSLAIMSDEQAEEIPELAERFGVTAYKFYVGFQGPATPRIEDYRSEWGIPVHWDDGTDFIGFENIGKIGGLAMLHVENFQIIRVLEPRVVASGRKDLVAWSMRSPGWTHAIDVAKYAHMARVTGTTLYVVHMGSREGLDEIRAAKARGTRIICETTPHHLIVDPEASFPGPRARINPPVEQAQSRDALWEGIRDGTIECIGTDQVPGQQVENIVDDDVWKGHQGFESTQIMLPLMITEGYHARGVPLEKLVALCSTNAAKYFGLYPRKGTIQVGSDADLIIVDVDTRRTVDEKDPTWSDSSNFSIYQGRELRGWPIMTMVRGTVVMKDRQIVGPPVGKYVPQRVGANR